MGAGAGRSMRSFRDESHRRTTSLSERVYGCLLRAYPRQQREEFGDEMTSCCVDLCRDARQVGFAALAWLWTSMLLPELLRGVLRERCEQGVGVLRTLAVSRRLVGLGALGAVLAGLVSLASAALPILKTSPSSIQILPWQLLWNLPTQLPLVESPLVGDALTAAGCMGLYFFLPRRSRLALTGLMLVCATVILSVALRSSMLGGGALGILSSESVNWLLVVGTFLVALAALRAPVLGWWRILPLFLAASQSPLINVPTFTLAGHMIRHATLERVPLVMELIPLLLYGPQALIGLGWVTLGLVLWRRNSGGKRGNRQRRIYSRLSMAFHGYISET